jgi:hypothetical protein
MAEQTVAEILVDPCGDARSVYSDQFDYAALGTVQIRRASVCEPDEQGRWWADLAPVNGPKLGPFDKRSAALEAELKWLGLHVLA